MEKKKLNGKMLLLQIDVFLTFKSQDESNLILYLPFCQSSKLMGKCKNEGLGGKKKKKKPRKWNCNAPLTVPARVDTVIFPRMN